MPDIHAALESLGPIRGTIAWLSNMSVLGLPWQGGFLSPTWNQPAPIAFRAMALFAFIALCIHETRNRRDDALVLFGMMALTLAFSIAVYPLAIRHLMLIALMLVLLVWRRVAEGEAGPSSGFRAWLLAAALCGLATATINLLMPFDSSPVAAREIVRRGLAQKDWMAYPQSSAQGVAALTGILFERNSDSCVQDFVRWNHTSERATRSREGLFGDLERKMRQDGRFYVLTDRDIPERAGFIRRLAVAPAGYDGQRLAIYVVGENLPESHARHPRCNGAADPLRQLPLP